MEPLERFDQQVVDRKPDRATPVRVAAEHAGSYVTPAWVVDAVFGAVHAEEIRILSMDA